MIQDHDPGDEDREEVPDRVPLTLDEVRAIMDDTARRARDDRYRCFRHGGRPR